MKWFKKLFRRKPDPLAVLRQPIPYEVFIDERRVMHADMMRDAVLQGVVSISPYCDAAPGTRGAAIMDAVQRGYLRLTVASRYDYVTGAWTSAQYEATQLGRNQYA